jgi:hypothetical protein
LSRWAFGHDIAQCRGLMKSESPRRLWSLPWSQKTSATLLSNGAVSSSSISQIPAWRHQSYTVCPGELMPTGPGAPRGCGGESARHASRGGRACFPTIQYEGGAGRGAVGAFTMLLPGGVARCMQNLSKELRSARGMETVRLSPKKARAPSLKPKFRPNAAPATSTIPRPKAPPHRAATFPHWC